jgi:copper chaperone CopZ
MIQRIRVAGMTCQNCVRHVSAALSDLAGVGSVTVDLASGDVQIESDRELPRAQLQTCLEEAGYTLA